MRLIYFGHKMMHKEEQAKCISGIKMLIYFGINSGINADLFRHKNAAQGRAGKVKYTGGRLNSACT